MKNILKYILSFAFCVGVIFATTTTVNAEDKPTSYATVDINQGETYYFYMKWSTGSEYHYQLADNFTYSGTGKMALYLGDTSKYPMWIREASTSQSIPSFRSYTNFETCANYGSWPIGNGSSYTNLVLVELKTNIPIFATQDLANQYRSGSIGIDMALNYKKISQNGSWVRPFEDFKINDSNMSSPQLANVSHSGFTVVNIPDDRYMVDVYLESGIQNPLPYEISLTSIGDALFVNSFGLVSDTEGAFTGEIDLLSCYGVDNVSALNESVSQFYSTYPSINAFNDSLPMETLRINKPTWSIWGQPFGKSFVFFSKSTSATGTVSADNCPLAYTNYKVRYFYYDDDSGFHYGPWTNFVYFSDGRVMRGEVFQGNDGNIIESPLESGTQDSSGNISMNYGSLVDIENPNELFGYLRSLINNINATGNNFMTLFGTVFSFLPSDLLAIIWLGIGCMILIGIIRAFN